MLAHPQFSGTRRRREFLRFLIEETLAGRADRLKGYAIALDVFGRGEDFQAQSDPVVRLEARRLRRDLDSYYVDPGRHDPVRVSIPKGGYIPVFEWQDDAPAAPPAEPDASEGEAAPPDPLPPAGMPANPHGLARISRRALAAVVLALVLLAGGLWLWWPASQTGDDLARGPAIIVLPFQSLSGNADDGFLAAGMTQELITKLMRFEDFRLYSVPASFGQDRQAAPADVGRELGVSYVIKGSVRSDGSAARVNSQLFDTRSGQVLWSETYDRPLTPGALLGVQDELAANIAVTLGQPYGVVNRNESDRLSQQVVPSMPSYACVLKARQYRRTFDSALHGPVLDCLAATIKRDPGYAAAWALLGWLHLDAFRYGYAPKDQMQSELQQALAFASRAAEIDPENVVALQALSAVQFHMAQFAESERTQRKALALNPNDPDTLAQLGWRLAVRGRWDEGIAYLEKAIARTVSPPGWYYDLISIHLYMQGKYEEMLVSAQHGAAGDPTGLSFLAIAYGALGETEKARDALNRMAKQWPELGREPETVYRRFQPTEEVLQAVLTGLRAAGWTAPSIAHSDN